MRVFLTWVLGAPLAVAAVVVAVANRQPAALELWPFPVVLELPIYLLLLVPLGAGLLIGFALAWLSQARWRRRARQNRRRVESLEREVAVLRQKAAEAAAAPARQPGTLTLPPQEARRA